MCYSYLSIPSKHQSSYTSVSLTLHFTNLFNTSKSHFKLHATNSGNFVNISLCFSKSFRPMLKKSRFRFYREYLEFRRNVEISLKFAIKLQSYSLVNDIKNVIISSNDFQTHFAFMAKTKKTRLCI